MIVVVKIIFLNRYFYPDHSATSQLLGDLAFALAGEHQDITVLTSRQLYDDASARLEPRETVRGVRVVRMWTTHFGRQSLPGRALDYLTFYISAFVHLLVEAGKGDIVVAETDPPLISVVASWVARWKKARLVNWIQDLFPEVAVELGVAALRGRVGRMARALRNASLNVAARNVVLGERMKQKLIGEGVNASRISIIHNWTDEGTVHPVDRADNPLREEWGLGDRFVVGYSGNMGRAHDFDAVLDAAEQLRARTDIVFVFIGNGAQRSWVERQIAERKLTNAMLKDYQPRERLAQSLSVPDLHFLSLKPQLEGLIVPSKFYGIAAAGRAMLFAGSPSGEIATILDKANCGISIGIEDADGLVRAVEKCAENNGRCEQMGALARQTYERCYGMEKSIGAWRDVIENL
jgi:glycosyltransferase involved in cell wall biosynthesis